MNKKTIIIVTISLILSIIAVSVIATFPTYLFEETKEPTSANPNIQSGNVTEQTLGDDVANVGDSSEGVEDVMPGVNDSDIGLPEAPLSNYKTLVEKSGAKLLASDGTFQDGTKFKISKLGIFNKSYYVAKHRIKDFAENFVMYNITAKKDGKAVTSEGTAKVVIEIPKKYDTSKTEVYFLLSNGTVTKLNSTINNKDRTVVVPFTESGVYILVESKPKTDTSDESENSSSEPSSSSENQGGSVSDDLDSSDNSSNDSSNSSTDPDESEESSKPVVSDKDESDSSDSSSSNESDSSDSSNSSSTPSEPDENQETMDGWTPWQ